MSVRINPRKLRGPWAEGYALDLHTTRSVFLGHNSYGHPQFETERTPLGDLVYRLKNHGDQSAIVPIPPSNTLRKNQPVLALATAISARAGLPLCVNCIMKRRSTLQLKDVFDPAERMRMLHDIFAADHEQISGQQLLLFDDLYRSGATASTVCEALTTQGGASAVHLLTLTQTRKNL